MIKTSLETQQEYVVIYFGEIQEGVSNVWWKYYI